MKFFRSLKKIEYDRAAHKMKRLFSEFDNSSVENIESNLRSSGIEFYRSKREPVPVWMRFTLPLALVMWILLFVFLPINFMITGKWGYKSRGWIYNWFESLGFGG